MCGIAGLVSRSAQRAPVERMVGAMHHRGPDDAGIWESSTGRAVLGNTRLAIIDLSESGHMPMSDTSGRVWITYNGELYNLPALREELVAVGYPFRSQTDTEVILAAWLTWGETFLDRLTGMFAFAIYDERDPKDPVLLLARDRLGIKPLYWTATDGGVLFASEIKVLLHSSRVAPRVDRQAVSDYLSLGSVIGPRTIIEGVHSLPPASTLTLRGGRIETKPFWTLPPPSEARPRSMEEASRQLRELLERVTAEHMIADVPVGAFLSGGIDSTTVVALAARHVSGPLQTFTVKFGHNPAAEDEARHSALMADSIGADHTEVFVSGEMIAAELDHILGAMDQPSVDGVNSWFVSRATGESVKVALSGIGSDEIFGGYPHFRHFARAARVAPNGSQLLASTQARIPTPHRVHAALAFLAGTPAERHARVREVFSATQKQRLFPSFQGNPATVALAPILEDDDDPVNATARAEAKGYVVNTLLRDADAMSMAHSLEVRVPFMDHRVVEFALSLPGDLKIVNGTGKAVLKQALKNLLPAEILSRPKSYFSLPLHEWAAGALLPSINRLTTSDSLRGLLDPAEIDAVTHAKSGGHGGRSWALAVLGGWLDTHGICP
jgi:asparagine synthase (glutamine-hydrolysing)